MKDRPRQDIAARLRLVVAGHPFQMEGGPAVQADELVAVSAGIPSIVVVGACAGAVASAAGAACSSRNALGSGVSWTRAVACAETPAWSSVQETYSA